MEEMIIKIAPVIIEDSKFLIVRGNSQDFWKNVGGVLEAEETEIECLRREVSEELGVQIKGEPEYYFSVPVTETVTEPKRDLIINLYRAELSSAPTASSEIEELHWLTKAEFESGEYNIAYQIHDYVVPRLIKDGLLE